MIFGLIHSGSGLGDSLFTYITVRTRALDLGVPFGFIGKEYFKGNSFLNLDWGEDVSFKHHIEQGTGKLIIDEPHNLIELNTPYFNPEFFFIEDGTVIDATCAQDEKYWGHRLNEIREWLKVEPLEMPDDLCVINFRGGEFATVSELFLPKEYWNEAIDLIHTKLPIRYIPTFEIHTDDPELAKKLIYLPAQNYEVIKDIALNWRSVRYARHLILSNSAFGILPMLLNENLKEAICPRYWARRNTKTWSMPSNFYKRSNIIYI